MKLKVYQVDAFAEKLFTGNPASICPLTTWLPDRLMQQIAMENNQAETAFYVRKDDVYEIRWFTPSVEVDLCGHATLASAFVIFNKEHFPGKVIHFHSPRSGNLNVSRNGEMLTLDFPADSLNNIPLTEDLLKCFDVPPVGAYRGKTDYMLLFENENQVAGLKPDFVQISKLHARGVIVTAPGNSTDFVSRFFAPQSGIDEDPVTGSAHTSLTPLWHQCTGKKEMTALQLSARTGKLLCTFMNDRILIGGQARLYLEGTIEVGE